MRSIPYSNVEFEVDCPLCDAVMGWPCHNRNGDIRSAHKARKLAALAAKDKRSEDVYINKNR